MLKALTQDLIEPSNEANAEQSFGRAAKMKRRLNMGIAILDRFALTLVDIYVLRHRFTQFKALVNRSEHSQLTSLSVAAPRIANFKFLWRKLFDHDPRFTVVSDKLAAKRFVAELGIEVEMPKTLWEGDLQDFPKRFLDADVVIKSNHGWNTSVFPKRDDLDEECVKRGILIAASQKHGIATDEWAYFNIKPKMLVEERIDTDANLLELKMYTYGPQVLRVVQIRTTSRRERVASVWLFDKHGCLQRSDQPSAVNPRSVDTAPLPSRAMEAVEIAKEIGGYFDHMRVDFLVTRDRLLLGELTVYNHAGFLVGGDAEKSENSRNWDLRRSWFLNAEHTGWKKHYAKCLMRFCAREARREHALNNAGQLSREKFETSMDIAERLLRSGG